VAVSLYMRMSDISESELSAAPSWQTLGQYLRNKPDTPHKQLLRRFTYLEWRRYSGPAHAAFEAYIGHESLGTYFVLDALSHGLRPRVEENYPKFVTRHIARAALILLCTVTEIQAHCRFDGANIDARRICKVWEVLLPLSETKELYAGRYSDLMKEKGITGG
jgi:hypothetical protein